jgi:hypothetical protein
MLHGVSKNSLRSKDSILPKERFSFLFWAVWIVAQTGMMATFILSVTLQIMAVLEGDTFVGCGDVHEYLETIIAGTFLAFGHLQAAARCRLISIAFILYPVSVLFISFDPYKVALLSPTKHWSYLRTHLRTYIFRLLTLFVLAVRLPDSQGKILTSLNDGMPLEMPLLDGANSGSLHVNTPLWKHVTSGALFHFVILLEVIYDWISIYAAYRPDKQHLFKPSDFKPVKSPGDEMEGVFSFGEVSLR